MSSESKPRPEARRLLAADLFAKGKSYIEVAKTLVVSEEAARKWKLRWDAGGREALKEKRDAKRGPEPALTDQQAKRLMARARKEGKADTLAALVALARAQGLDVSRSALRRKLIALGYWPAGEAD